MLDCCCCLLLFVVVVVMCVCHLRLLLLVVVPQAPPMDIIIAVVTNISATLSWRPPPRAFNNGPLTGYDVMASNLFTINGLFVSLRRKTASNMTSVKIDGLLPFNKYEVRVAAHTSAGRGPWSDSKHFTTKSASMSFP